MGVYVYKVTAKRVALDNGEFANVAVFAYKDHFWDTALVAKMRRNSACFVADRFVEGKNFTGNVVMGIGTVAKKINCGTFDDNWFDRQPIYANVKA